MKFSQIADSFPGMDIPAVVPQGASPQPIRLKNPPKWFACTAGASFAVSSLLITAVQSFIPFFDVTNLKFSFTSQNSFH